MQLLTPSFNINLPPGPQAVLNWLASALLHLSAFAPVAFLASLYALAWRAYALIGHWPVYVYDDPKNIGQLDGLYQALYQLNRWLFYAWWIAPAVFAVVVWLTGARFSRRHLQILLAVLVIGICALAFDPTRRMLWFLD